MRPTTVEPVKLDAHELAMLNGGPDLVITSAAVKLRAKLVAQPGGGPGTFIASGRLGSDAADIEQELFDAVRRAPGITAHELLRALGGCEPVRRIATRLTEDGLLRHRSGLRLRRPRATARGRALLRRSREEHPQLRGNAREAELPLAVALFGGAALWAVDAHFAAAWGVLSQPGMWWSGGGYGCGGSCGGGCGGCG